MTMVGVWMLVTSIALIVIEGAVVAVWTSRLSRRMRALNARVTQESRLVQADMEKLRLALDETARLWEPYRKVLRRVRHPLVVALIASYLRQRAAV